MVFVKTCVISLLLFFYIMVILCFQTDVEEARPRWGKNSKLVLVSLLLTGLLLAALLVAGYYFKTHRKNSKGVRLVSQLEEVGLVVLCQNDSECVVLKLHVFFQAICFESSKWIISMSSDLCRHEFAQNKS